MSYVALVRRHFQIAETVVLRIAVDMIYDLAITQTPANVNSRDNAVG